MNSDTPETDAEFDHLRFAVEPNQFGCESQRDVVVFGMRDFARKLERERNALKTECTMLQLERSQAVRERDQLRKVCDSQSEMIKWYTKEFGMPKWGFEYDKLKAIDSLYHQLPHVKEKNK